MRSVVFIPADLEPAKIAQARALGATVVRVDGPYDDVNRLCLELTDELEGWAVLNVNLRPFYAEGSKTIAIEIAQQLGVDHLVFNFGDEFEAEVVAPYVEAHAQGRTPNPCIECNRRVRFRTLLHRAEALGCAALVTGHHARIDFDDGVARVAFQADRMRAQSNPVGDDCMKHAGVDSFVGAAGSQSFLNGNVRQLLDRVFA